MKYCRKYPIIVVLVALLVATLACTSAPTLSSGPHMRCPAWAQFNPDSTCDAALSTETLGSGSLKVDMSEYEAARMSIVNYDVIAVKWKDVRIETDSGQEVILDTSRLLPGSYIIYNTIFNADAESDEDTVDDVYLELINPQGNDSAKATIQFEFIRPARPTPVPTPTEESAR